MPFDRDGRAFLRASLPTHGPDAAPFSIAATLAGRYAVGPVVSVGEVSVVLSARDLRTGRGVLVKALRPDAIAPPPGLAEPAAAIAEELRGLRHGLQAERRILVRLRNLGVNAVPHPNDYVFDLNPALADPPFVDPTGRPWLDRAAIEAEPYLVLRRIPGTPLDALLADRSPVGMDEATAIALIRPIAEALARLHEPWAASNGRRWHCVYLDMKPSNIIVDPIGRAHLIDFGGCQVVVDGVLVLDGAHTPGYAAPECDGPPRVLLPAADVYGLGATLRHMLTGVDPRGRRPRDPAPWPPGVSPGLRDLMERCLRPRPSDRPADAVAVLRLLDALAPSNLAASP